MFLLNKVWILGWLLIPGSILGYNVYMNSGIKQSLTFADVGELAKSTAFGETAYAGSSEPNNTDQLYDQPSEDENQESNHHKKFNKHKITARYHQNNDNNEEDCPKPEEPKQPKEPKEVEVELVSETKAEEKPPVVEETPSEEKKEEQKVEEQPPIVEVTPPTETTKDTKEGK